MATAVVITRHASWSAHQALDRPDIGYAEHPNTTSRLHKSPTRRSFAKRSVARLCGGSLSAVATAKTNAATSFRRHRTTFAIVATARRIIARPMSGRCLAGRLQGANPTSRVTRRLVASFIPSPEDASTTATVAARHASSPAQRARDRSDRGDAEYPNATSAFARLPTRQRSTKRNLARLCGGSSAASDWREARTTAMMIATGRTR